ncbi:high-potential iron-sulfur protein [Paraburkholderia fungorum]|uniref:high-potential iron-sulfur protein n=1 Tax=Paraburkholderia fungorum TaxID=134537 RepID=UPI00209226FD|nr:high-potential iron-sulfur protein [Paraburkholderia fungorum]USU18519.1 high-potential iron-sulfur protein [Paraburkholderia fungorum]USU26418.1 high-potential iron-sulfur protein [Paraburkholderia fungorum]
MQSSRRQFIVLAASIASSSVFLGKAQAATAVVESDPTAQALGYKADASQVDHAKFTKYQAGQACVNCQLFQGKAGDTTGPCPIFAGKEVSAKGWCSAYVKKA